LYNNVIFYEIKKRRENSFVCERVSASDKAYQLHAHGRWFSPDTPASSTTKTGSHDIAEILLKVALKQQTNPKKNQSTNRDHSRTFLHEI
jgi:hypothetical protein